VVVEGLEPVEVHVQQREPLAAGQPGVSDRWIGSLPGSPVSGLRARWRSARRSAEWIRATSTSASKGLVT
jgi:hypothetical protein